ncbi:MAG: M2 family metallopeptidase [Gemmatimonadota bacterium]|nr:M2 family metallopeptidase [Gemmatimonadota bacterium]
MPRAASLAIILVLLTACSGDAGLRQEVDTYLSTYNQTYQTLAYAAQQADWASQTHIVDGDTVNAARTRAAKEALAAFSGSVENIEKIRDYLKEKSRLIPLEVSQLEMMLFFAGDNPATAATLVQARIAAETEQTEKLYGYAFRFGGKEITPNEIDRRLRESTDLAERQVVWESSKAIGPTLKPGILKLRDLRNGVVQALGYPDYFSYQVSAYGMTSPEMLALMDTLNVQLRPLYRELHTWARYELAKKYHAPVPDLIPAHWLPNRWAQDWSDLVSVSGLDVDAALKPHDAEWVVKQGEAFYVSLGFPPLPASFWEQSSLYPAPADAGYKKNTHASAWHLDLDQDVRSLMSVEPNREWWETVHHELGHIYYFLSYSRPEIPVVLRTGANPAYHEGLGTMIGLASLQRQALVNRGLIPADAKVDQTQKLLQEALQYVVFIPWAAGTMPQWEHAFYADSLPADSLNAKWWEVAAKYQGIAPPAPRGEEFADAVTKTHINDNPGFYYSYAVAQALLFQLHDHIAREILKQDPHDTDYFGHKDVGDFLRTILAPGATRPWREVLQQSTGRTLDARAIVEYFAPLEVWLREQNRGRTATLPPL